jgi:aminoglycoside 3-N-acetyltransferase
MQLVNSELFKEVRHFVSGLDAGVFYIHSDILKGFNIRIVPFSAHDLLSAHYEALRNLTQPAAMWFPVFNLNFSKTRVYDVRNTTSQMGHLSEFARENKAKWQDEIPMHGTCGTGAKPTTNRHSLIDPWGKDSVFHQLIQQNGYLLFYGAGLEAISIIHFIEKQCGVPYRYEKLFEGTRILGSGLTENVTVSHMVRPLNYEIEYDWNKLSADLLSANLLSYFSDKRSKIFFIHAGKLLEFWTMKIKEDPFYLLDTNSKALLAPILNKLGRPFEINDFEKPHEH